MNTLTETSITKNILLHDGIELTIKPIRPEDVIGLQLLLHRLAPETVFFRFLSFRSYLPDVEAHHLARVNYQNRMAFVATRWVAGVEEIVGVARYDVLDKIAPGAAEVAIVVEDQFQDQGLGTHLMKHLIHYAQTHRVKNFLFLVHEANDRFIRFLHHLGLPLEASRSYGSWELKMSLVSKDKNFMSSLERKK